MKKFFSLVVTGPEIHGFQETARQPLPDDHVRVQVAAVAFCGTDFKLLGGRLHDAKYPVVPGHEWSGFVVDAPSAPELVGKLVVASIYSPCGICEWCHAGECQHCVRLDEYGFTLPGGCAEEIVVPKRNVRLVPDGVSFSAACLFEPLTVAIHAIDRAPDLMGRTVVVLGAGAVGLLLLQLVRRAGGECAVVEPLASRRELASSLGACATYSTASEMPERSADVTFDATGSPISFGEALRLLKPCGTCLLVGYSGDAECSFAPSILMLKEVTVRGVLSGYGTLDRAIDAVASGAVRLEPLVATPIRIEDYSTLLSPGIERAPRQPMILPSVRAQTTAQGSAK